MKFTALLTALLVALALYGIVFERERLFTLAGRETPVDAAPEPAIETEAAADEAERRVAVVAIDSAARQIADMVTLRGRTEAVRKVQVMAQTSGLVVSEPLRAGALIEAGDVLCEIDPADRAVALAEAQAALAEARINDVAAARLAEGGFASETRTAQAKAVLLAAEAAVARAETELTRLTIAAPFSGVLETDTAELGSLLQPGSPCAEVIRLDPIKVVAFLPESAITKVAPGAPASITLADGRSMEGEIGFVARSADPDTRTFRVEVALPNPDLAVRDGQSARLDIAASGRSAHFIPASALTLDDAGTMGVRVVEDGVVRFVPVTILRDSRQGVEVAGLPDEARIIVVGQEFVREGVAVDVTLRENGA